MMSMKDLQAWDGKDTLEDIISLGINPLLDLTKIIDYQIDDLGLDCTGELFTLNRMLYSGLLDMQKSLESMWKSFQKEEPKAA